MESMTLGNRYELLERVGMGGMAVVYKAMDKVLNRYVAIKILREEFKENEEFIHRFKVESQAAASLSHQNIVQIYDVGEEEGLHYIVMELLEGETLKSYIVSKEGRLSRREALNFSIQICRALEHAHSKHVVHRDIKPQNIVLTTNGKIKVADFGIARAANNTTTVNTGSYAVGSAHYLSPEQARGGYTDHRTDIYSLGVVMYEMFTGKLPFDAEESIGVVMQHIHNDPPLPSDISPDIPAGIEAIILRAMSKEQRLRYESAAEILEDLIAVYQNPSISVKDLNAGVNNPNIGARKKSSSGKAATPHTPKKKWRNRKKGIIIATVSFFVALLILFFVVISTFLFSTGKEISVPDLVGKTYDEALLVLDKASDGNVDFSMIIYRSVHSDEEANTIIEQTPEGGRKVKSSKEIKVTISLGPVALKLDNYTGEDFEKIQNQLEEKGIKVVVVHEDNEAYPEGKIFKQFPSKGTQMSKGDEVTLYVSKGVENTIVPDVVGLPEKEARIEIEEKGLKVKVSYEASSTALRGEVIRQSKKEFDRVPLETVIEITVSSGKDSLAGGDDSSNDPSDTKKEKRVSVKLTNLSKTEPTKVKIIIDGVKVYEGDVSTSTGAYTVSFSVASSLDLSHGADIYYDNTYRTTKEVN